MKILFFDFSIPYLLKDNEYPVGGFSIQLSNWIVGLGEIGAKVGVLSWSGANEHAGRPEHVQIIDTYNPREGIKILKYFYLYIPKLIAGAKTFKPDVIIQACSGVNTGILAFVAGRLRVPFVYRVANDMDVDGRCHQRLRQYERYAYYYGLRKAAAIICQNDYQYNCLKERYPEKTLFKIHNPYDIRKAVSTVTPRKERAYVAWLGVFQKQKNLPLLLQIAKALPEVPFKIAGMATKTIDDETAMAVKELEALSNVTFVGYIKRTHVLEFLSEAICLLSTSHYEGFSNTFLESFAASTPVVCPLRIDPDKIIQTHGLGLTTNNDNELSEMLERICQMDEQGHDKLSQECLTYLLANFSPSVKANDLVDSLNKVVK